MNSFIIILIVAVAATAVLAQGPGGREEFKQVIETCKTKVGATSDDIDQMKQRKSPTTRTGQCLVACFKKQTGMMDADNKMNVENTKKKMEHMKEKNPDKYAKIVKALDECKAQEKPETDECVAAKNFVDCMESKKQ